MPSQCKRVCAVMAIIVTLVDMSIGWYNAYEMYIDTHATDGDMYMDTLKGANANSEAASGNSEGTNGNTNSANGKDGDNTAQTSDGDVADVKGDSGKGNGNENDESGNSNGVNSGNTNATENGGGKDDDKANGKGNEDQANGGVNADDDNQANNKTVDNDKDVDKTGETQSDPDNGVVVDDGANDKGKSGVTGKGRQKQGEEDLGKCQQPKTYWYLLVVFESAGTIFSFTEIYYVIMEIQNDNKIQQQYFGRAFLLVVLIYTTSVFPAAILEIVYQHTCVCSGFYLLEDLSKWRRHYSHFKRDVRSDVRKMSKTLLGGVSVIFLQLILHLPDIYETLRKVCDVLGSMCSCCSLACETAQHSTDQVTDIDDPTLQQSKGQIDKQKTQSKARDTLTVETVACPVETKSKRRCFIISSFLSFVFVMLFLAETAYIFCDTGEK